jgi:hypothetical protein
MDDVEMLVGRGIEINVHNIFKALFGNFISKSKRNIDEGSENIAVVASITSM